MSSLLVKRNYKCKSDKTTLIYLFEKNVTHIIQNVNTVSTTENSEQSVANIRDNYSGA